MKKLFKLFVCLCIATGLIFSYPVAQSENNQPATIYGGIEIKPDGTAIFDRAIENGSLSEMVNSIYSNSAGVGIVISDDVKLESGLVLYPNDNDDIISIYIDGDVVLDLNGQSVTQLPGYELADNAVIVVPKGSNLTITDSSAEKNGSVDGIISAISVVGGTLTLDGGTFSTNEFEIGSTIVVTNGGKLIVNSGKITNNITGYFDNPGIDADSSSFVEINGGCFSFDISKYLPVTYRVRKDNGWFYIENVIPNVSASSENGPIAVNVDVVLNEKQQKIVKLVADAKIIMDKSVSARFDVTELIKFADSLESVEEVEVLTGILDVYINRNTIKKIENNADDKIYLTIDKNYNLSKNITDKLSSAKYEVSYNITDESGKIIYLGGTVPLKINLGNNPAQTNTSIYHVNGESLYLIKSGISEKTFDFQGDNGKKFIISEGAGVMISGRTLDLQGTISLVFYANLEGVNVSDARMLFWTSPQTDYTEKTALRSVSFSGKDSNGYKFEFRNISSKEMSQKVYARLVAKDSSGNKIYSAVPKDGYSVVNYAENMMENIKLKPLLVKMLNYGAAAQEYFGSEYQPSNSILSDGEKVVDMTKIYKSDANTIPEKTSNGKCLSSIAGKTLTLDGDISINYYVSAGEEVDEIGMLFWTEETYEESQNHILGTQSRVVKSYNKNSKYFVFSYENIVSKRMFEPIYARVYVRKGNVYKYSDIDKYSAKDYAVNQIEKNSDPKLIKLLRCLLLYGDEAEKYFRLN